MSKGLSIQQAAVIGAGTMGTEAPTHQGNLHAAI